MKNLSILSEMPETTKTLNRIAAMLNKFIAKGKTTPLRNALNVLEAEQPTLYANMVEIYKATNFGKLLGIDSTCTLEFSEKVRMNF